MAQLRRNHQKASSNSTFWVRLFIFGILFIGVMIYAFQKSKASFSKEKTEKINYKQMPIDLVSDENIVNADSSIYNFIPTGSTGEIIHHQYYSLSYMEADEQAEWVAYVLDANNLKKPHLKRNARFTDDKMVSTTSAFHNDYSNSGYTRGHLAPFGDMSFDKQAIEECFLMSNMSPQTRQFNNGVWKELEEQTRDWAFQKSKLFITTGPLLKDQPFEKIGKNQVSVPKKFYKAILNFDNKQVPHAIGFIIPNQECEAPLSKYAVPIDEIERETGLDLFHSLLDSSQETVVESKVNLSFWPVSEARYKMRVNQWNKEK